MKNCSMLLAFAVCVAESFASARATSVVPLSPEQVLANADIIFEGTVTGSSARWTTPSHSLITTDYTIRIDRVLNDAGGLLAARTNNGSTTLSFAGGWIGDEGVEVAGVPKFAPGDRAFFFIYNDDLNAFSPVIGEWQGLYRIGTLDGHEVVTRVSACCGRRTPVTSHYFSRLADQPQGFTSDEFAAEVARALPIVRANASLRFGPHAPIPENLRGLAFTGDQLPICTIGQARPSDPSGASAQPAPMPPGPGADKPLVAQRHEGPSDPSDSTEFHPRMAPRYGLTAGEPNPPRVFNIPPLIYPNFGTHFEYQLAYWNRYAPDVFRKYVTSDNTLDFHNGRNDTGFLNNAQMMSVYGSSWGTGTLARCITYISLTYRIVESDIAVNSAYAYTTDYATAFNSYNPACADTGTPSTCMLYWYDQIALHELGHAIARSHQWDSDPGATFPSVMNYYSDAMQPEAGRLFTDDAESIRVLYPAHAAALTDGGVYLWKNTGTLSGGTPSVNNTAVATFPAAAVSGTPFSVTGFTFENVGTVPLAPILDWYLCPARQTFAGAFYCSSTSSFGAYTRNSSVVCTRTVSIPPSVPSGTYFLGVVINNDPSDWNSSNWSRATIAVTQPVPANDACAGAQNINEGVFYGTTASASNDGAASCGLSDATPDVWYRYFPTCNGTAEISTAGSAFDTVLAVRWACGRAVTGFLTELACNDDCPGGSACAGTTDSYIQFPAGVGTPYYIRISGYNGATGAYRLSIRCLPPIPPEEVCGGMPPVPDGTYGGSTHGSHAETGTHASCGSSSQSVPPSPDSWFTYIPQATGMLRLSTAGSDFDTVLAVHTSCSPGNDIELACNDDCPPGSPCAGSNASYIELPVTVGVPYQVRVAGFDGATGNYSLTVQSFLPQPPTNNACASAIPYQPLPGASGVAFNTALATTDGPPAQGCAPNNSTLDVGSDIWFIYNNQCNGNLIVSLCGSSYDSQVAIYSGTCANPGPVLACNDDSCGLQSIATVAGVHPGQQLLVRVGGYQGARGSGTLSISCVLLPRRSDWNADGQLTVTDIFAFLSDWFRQASGADYDQSGVTSVSDIFAFLADWFAGA